MSHDDHSGHGGHGGMDMGPKCAMHMLWNTQIIDTCIVFPQWHVTSNASFILSFLVIVGLGVAYEWLRVVQRRVDLNVARSLLKAQNDGVVSGASTSRAPTEEDGLLTESVKGYRIVSVPSYARVHRALLYGTTIFLSFFLMLVFMTFNAYLILAVVLGAALGHFIFSAQMDPNAILSGSGMSGKGMACH